MIGTQRIVFCIFFCGLLAGQAQGPERRVQGSEIVSDHDPKVRIRLPKPVQYAGADRWVLYDIADCELHVFVEADQNKNVQRLYWVQFEGFIPAKPELKYQYDSPRHTSIGGLDFFVDTWVRPHDAPVRPGSDREHVQSLARAKGYKTPAGMMYVRLVHLLNEQKRRELMIIYGEDLAPAGFAAADLAPDGKAHDRWPALEQDLIERVRQKITLEAAAP
ncbi:MAG TPA: hypothetical protein VKW06_05605 [Candidatus Angelobacter sp.]|nr:hypothetical protein [Candidatus Angelobacter sp.]